MVRHQDLSFTRPIPESELIQRIEKGDILASDEIAAGNGYWFSIQEIDEVRKHFGEHIRLQSLIPNPTEITSSTNTALLLDKDKVRTDKFTDQFADRNDSKEPKLVPISTGAAQPTAEKRPTPIRVPVSDDTPVRAKLALGGVLVAIFCGTLLALWLGSQ